MEMVSFIPYIVQAVTAVAAGAAANNAAKSAAKANEYNAAVMRQQADTAMAVSNQREEQQRRQNRIDFGKMAAAAAQSGLGTGGTNADVLGQNAVLMELDALNIRYGGASEALSLESSARGQDFSAAANRASGRNASTLSYFNAAGSALSGYGNYLKTKGNKGK